jgi:hypothetical protein
MEFTKGAVFYNGSYNSLKDGSMIRYNMQEVIFAQINFQINIDLTIAK